MGRYVLAGVASGIAFGILDALMNGNSIAARLYKAYEPIARTSISVPAGAIVDFVFAFAMAGIFLLLYRCLPGSVGTVKGISFGVGVWFFRVVMSVASQWMTFRIPVPTLLYTLGGGLVEMLVLGIIYGLILRPSR